MSLVRRVFEAHKDGRVLSGATRRIRALEVLREAVFRFRLGLPKVSGNDFPAIVTSGNFSNREGQALKTSLHAAIDGRGKLPAAIRSIKGMSGQKYRTFINTLIQKLDRPHYLEIVSWIGRS